jgi:hypothetical protein
MSWADVDHELSIDWLGKDSGENRFGIRNETWRSTNYYLEVRFDPKLNTVLLKDKSHNILFSQTAVRQADDGGLQPVWTPEKEVQSRHEGIQVLREAMQEQRAKVLRLRSVTATAADSEKIDCTLELEEEILDALTARITQLESANKIVENVSP